MTARPISRRLHDDGCDAWAVASAPASPSLAGIARGYASYWERTGSFITRRELPSSQAVMIVNLGAPIELVGGDGVPLSLAAGQGFVAGFHNRAALSRSSGAQAGVHVFMPLAGLHSLLGVDMDRLTDRVVDLHALLGPAAGELGQRLGATADDAARFDLLDQALGARLARQALRPTTAGRAVDWAVSRIVADPGCPTGALAADIGWSRKHLAAQFRRRIGSGPRHFARLIRFERVVASLAARPRAGWAELAAAHGYSDQSHLIRDMRDFAGLTPTAIAARLLPGDGGIREA